VRDGILKLDGWSAFFEGPQPFRCGHIRLHAVLAFPDQMPKHIWHLLFAGLATKKKKIGARLKAMPFFDFAARLPNIPRRGAPGCTFLAAFQLHFIIGGGFFLSLSPVPPWTGCHPRKR